MKKKTNVQKEQAKYDKGQVVVKVIAAILALMMILAVAASTIFAIFA